jgi:glycine cleavage system H protein
VTAIVRNRRGRTLHRSRACPDGDEETDVQYPDDLRYTDEHEWVRAEGDLVRVGITDYAQDALGDVVYVQLPDVDASFAGGDVFGEVESTKSVSDLYMPVAGTIVEVNDALSDTPELVNGAPYGDGWLVVVRPSDSASVSALRDAAGYAAYVAGDDA